MKNIALAVMIILLTSCQKDIDVTPKSNYQEELFIEGILYPGQVPRIYLSRAMPFFRPEVVPQEVFARGALVTISEKETQSTLLADSVFDPFRCRWVPFYEGQIPSKYGETYTLSVTYKGKTYSATTTINQPKVNISSVEYTPEFFDIYGGHDGVIVRFRDVASSKNYYRFQMDLEIDNERRHAHVLDNLKVDCSNGEFFPVTDLGRSIFSDEKIDGQLITMYIEVTYEYREGDTTWVMLQSLDEKAAKFYSSLDLQLQSIFNPFVEPVLIESQIKGAIGVFGSAVLSDSVLFVYPQDNP